MLLSLSCPTGLIVQHSAPRQTNLKFPLLVAYFMWLQIASNIPLVVVIVRQSKSWNWQTHTHTHDAGELIAICGPIDLGHLFYVTLQLKITVCSDDDDVDGVIDRKFNIHIMRPHWFGEAWAYFDKVNKRINSPFVNILLRWLRISINFYRDADPCGDAIDTTSILRLDKHVGIEILMPWFDKFEILSNFIDIYKQSERHNSRKGNKPGATVVSSLCMLSMNQSWSMNDNSFVFMYERIFSPLR